MEILSKVHKVQTYWIQDFNLIVIPLKANGQSMLPKNNKWHKMNYFLLPHMLSKWQNAHCLTSAIKEYGLLSSGYADCIPLENVKALWSRYPHKLLPWGYWSRIKAWKLRICPSFLDKNDESSGNKTEREKNMGIDLTVSKLLLCPQWTVREWNGRSSL